MVAHTLSPSTWETEASGSELKISQSYTVKQ